MGTTTATKKRKIRRIPVKRTIKLRLPTTLIEAVKEIGLEAKQEQQALHFLNTLIKRCYRENGDNISYTELCAKYFPKDYKEWLELLIDFDILHRSGFYKKGQSCRKYRIDSELLTQTIVTTQVTVKEEVIKQPSFYKHFIESVKELKIDEVKLWQKAEEITNNLSINDYLINEEIPSGKYKINYGTRLKDADGNPIKNYTKNSDEVIAAAKAKGHFIVMNPKKRKMHYAFNLDDFIKGRKEALYNHCDSIISQLADEDFKPSRNEANNRLDTVFTRMHENLWDVVKKENNWCEIDIRNSQFAFLANQMGKETDVAFYNIAAKLGLLYDDLAKKIDPSVSIKGLGDTKEKRARDKKARAKAKVLMFALCFSPITNKVEHRDVFKKWYPNAYKYMLNIKRNNPDEIPVFSKKDNYKALSISLQRMESSFFIDGVLKQCANDNIKAITRHDSISCRIEDKDAVYSIVEKQKNKFGYHFKIS